MQLGAEAYIFHTEHESNVNVKDIYANKTTVEPKSLKGTEIRPKSKVSHNRKSAISEKGHSQSEVGPLPDSNEFTPIPSADENIGELAQDITGPDITPQDEILRPQPRSPTPARTQQERHSRESPLLSESPRASHFTEYPSQEQEPQPSAGIPKPKAKISKLEQKVNKTSGKLDKAKKKIPSKRKIRIERSFDEDTGKGKVRLKFEKTAKTRQQHLKGPLLLRPVKFGVNAAIAKAHMKVFQVEDENVGVKAGHRIELAGESIVRSALRHRKIRPYKKAAKLERKLSKQSAKLTYRRAIEANPRLKRNPIARMWYKRKIKRQYAKQARQAQKAAVQSASLSGKAARLMAAIIKKNPKLWIIALVILLFMYMVTSFASLLSGIGSVGIGTMLISSYLADDMDITNASVLYTALEQDLIAEIENIPANYSGFDEHRINIDRNLISHNPLELMAYLTAVHLDFTGTDISVHLQSLFAEQHQLIFSHSIELRLFESEYGNMIFYEWHVLTVTLESRPFTDVIHGRLTDEQRSHFDVLMESPGNRQTIASPFDFFWHPYIRSHFGYRINPFGGGRQFHGGIDIALPTGTPIRAGHDGIVTYAGYNAGGFGNLVIIDSGDGLVTKYAHCHILFVSTGQRVYAGDVIAAVGSTGQSTGAHLHMEVLILGHRMNPAFFVASGA